MPQARKLTIARHPQIIEHRHRIAKAIELRRRGYTWQEIADKCGYKTAENVSKAVNTELERWVQEPSQAVIGTELSRLDVALDSLMDRVKQGDDRAIDSMLKIMDRRAKYLGLDAPKKADLHVRKEELRFTLHLGDKEVNTDAGEEALEGEVVEEDSA